MPSGHRYFDEADVRTILGRAPDKKATVVYCRGHIASENGCEIVVVKQESLSPQQEMVEDLMAIVHTFSCRLYGMRKYKQQLKQYFAEHKIPTPKEPCS